MVSLAKNPLADGLAAICDAQPEVPLTPAIRRTHAWYRAQGAYAASR
jgi:hypothetical protein